MIGLLCLAVGVGALVVTSVNNSLEDDNRRQTNSSKNFDTYIDTKGVQRSTVTNNCALRLWNDAGDHCLIDMKTGQVLRNYDAEGRAKIQAELDRLNKKLKQDYEEFIKTRNNNIDTKKELGYEALWVYEEKTKTYKIIKRRISDHVEILLSHDVTDKEYYNCYAYADTACPSIHKVKFLLRPELRKNSDSYNKVVVENPQDFFIVANQIARENNIIIECFHNYDDLRTKEDVYNLAKKIKAPLTWQEVYEVCGFELPEVEYIENVFGEDFKYDLNDDVVALINGKPLIREECCKKIRRWYCP